MSVVLIDVGMLCACSRTGTLHLFVQVLGGVWSYIKTLAPLVILVLVHVTQFVVCAFFSN